jgi:hypothetical protein
VRITRSGAELVAMTVAAPAARSGRRRESVIL